MHTWLLQILNTIHAHARARRVAITTKARIELRKLKLGLDLEDVYSILAELEVRDFDHRLESDTPDEWLYVFKPTVWNVVIYLKVVLRADCVVISFHRDSNEEDGQD